jgi:hypothetical protein
MTKKAKKETSTVSDSKRLSLEKVKFVKFLKLLCLKQDIENKEALISFNKDGISSLIVSSSKTLAIRAKYTGGATKFPELGDVGISNLPAFVKFVDSLDEVFTFELKNNRLKLISGKTKISLVVQNADYIANKLDNDKFNNVHQTTQGGISLSIPQKKCQEIVEKFGVIDSDSLTLKAKESKLILAVESKIDETRLISEIDDSVKDEFDFTIAKFFPTILSMINDSTFLFLAKENASAVCLDYNTEEFNITYLLALRSVEE